MGLDVGRKKRGRRDGGGVQEGREREGWRLLWKGTEWGAGCERFGDGVGKKGRDEYSAWMV